jgi:DNA-binding GntR family transcriptional regulator
MMKKLNNIGARTLREKAYQSIKESVLTNTFMPGESLSTDLLAESLGISHTPVREAVVRLADEGILDYEPNKKLRVSKITQEDVKQVYEVRRLLEVHVVKSIPDHLEKNAKLVERLRHLRKKTENLCQKTARPSSYSQVDLELNEIFLFLIENTILKELFNLVGDRALRIRTFVEATVKSRPNGSYNLNASAQEHLRIIKALEQGDIEKIEASIVDHLNNSEQRTLTSIKGYWDLHSKR